MIEMKINYFVNRSKKYEKNGENDVENIYIYNEKKMFVAVVNVISILQFKLLLFFFFC